MSNISRDTYKRLFLLYIIGCFPRGVMGEKRLHKTVYFSSKELERRPFDFIRWKHGQYSFDMIPYLTQLCSMGYIKASPLQVRVPENAGSKYELVEGFQVENYKKIVKSIEANRIHKVELFIKNIALRYTDEQLTEYAHKDPLYLEKELGEIMLEENLPDEIPVPMSREACEDLEISRNP